MSMMMINKSKKEIPGHEKKRECKLLCSQDVFLGCPHHPCFSSTPNLSEHHSPESCSLMAKKT